MSIVEMIAMIRRSYLVRGKSIKQIRRELHVSLNAARNVMARVSYTSSTRARALCDLIVSGRALKFVVWSHFRDVNPIQIDWKML